MAEKFAPVRAVVAATMLLAWSATPAPAKTSPAPPPPSTRAAATTATKPATTSATAKRGLTIELDEGVTMEILGVASSDHPEAGWWSPDGKPLAAAPAEVRPASQKIGRSDWPLWTIATDVSAEPAEHTGGFVR